MNKRKEEEDVADKGVVGPFRKRKSKLLKLAFSVPGEPGGFQFTHTMHSTLRDNAYLPVLAAMFSERHIDSLVYIDEEETAIFMDRNIDVFQHVIARLRIQTMDIRLVPKGVDADEWEAELDYWGYSAPELVNPIDLQARAILSILKKYMYAEPSEWLFQSVTVSTVKLVLWFLDGLSFRTPELEGVPAIEIADWFRKWGFAYTDYFKKELKVSDFFLIQKPADAKRSVLHSTCKWPSSMFQSDYRLSTRGYVGVELYFSIGGYFTEQSKILKMVT